MSRLREALGLTQAQLAKRISSTQTVVFNLEKETVDPRWSTLQRVAEGLNCELLLRLVPRENIEKQVRDRALGKARKIVGMSLASANLEMQGPSEKTREEEVKRIAERLMSEKRSRLWEED